MATLQHTDELYHILEDEICALKILPGEALSENQLCKRFGVSRTPIRSVLQRLEQNRFVQIIPCKGTIVTAIDTGVVDQLIFQRVAVEGMVCLLPLSVVVIVRGWKTFSVFICLAWIIGCLRTIAAHRVLLWRTPSVWEMRPISIIKNFLLKSEVMSTEEEYKELSAKLRYGLELAEQRLIEETARREGTLCYGRPDGKVVRISATELLKLRQSSGNNAASVAVCTCSEMESGWNR